MTYQNRDGTIDTFAQDITILPGYTTKETTMKHQRASDEITSWTRRWRIKINETNLNHVALLNNETISNNKT